MHPHLYYILFSYIPFLKCFFLTVTVITSILSYSSLNVTLKNLLFINLYAFFLPFILGSTYSGSCIVIFHSSSCMTVKSDNFHSNNIFNLVKPYHSIGDMSILWTNHSGD